MPWVRQTNAVGIWKPVCSGWVHCVTTTVTDHIVYSYPPPFFLPSFFLCTEALEEASLALETAIQAKEQLAQTEGSKVDAGELQQMKNLLEEEKEELEMEGEEISLQTMKEKITLASSFKKETKSMWESKMKKSTFALSSAMYEGQRLREAAAKKKAALKFRLRKGLTLLFECYVEKQKELQHIDLTTKNKEFEADTEEGVA